MSKRLCQYGDCENWDTRVSVGYSGRRVSFCSVDHAALWLLRCEYPNARIVLNDSAGQMAAKARATLAAGGNNVRK
jgi:hypothetical protein